MGLHILQVAGTNSLKLVRNIRNLYLYTINIMYIVYYLLHTTHYTNKIYINIIHVHLTYAVYLNNCKIIFSK